jgi:REP element-mobilizing transposase RayT
MSDDVKLYNLTPEEIEIVMPNHLHVVVINDNGRGMACHAPTKDKFGKPIPHSLSTIIGSYKSVVTRICNKNGTLVQWQRNYYEHIVRNEDELHRIRKYIINNPLKWEEDIENPLNWKKGKATNYYENLLIHT